MNSTSGLTTSSKLFRSDMSVGSNESSILDHTTLYPIKEMAESRHAPTTLLVNNNVQITIRKTKSSY